MNKIQFEPNDEETSIIGSNIVPAINKIPDWYKNIKPYFGEDTKVLMVDTGGPNTTVKVCSPFLDAMGIGYKVVLDEDVEVTWKDDAPMFRWRSNRTIITVHSFEQSAGLKFPDGYYKQVIKFANFMGIKTPKGYSLLCTSPINNFDIPFQVITGVVDTDKYNVPIQFPFFIKDQWSGIIPAGTTIAQLIPFKREEWQSELLEYDKKREYFKWYNFKRKIDRSYKTNYWTKKVYK